MMENVKMENVFYLKKELTHVNSKNRSLKTFKILYTLYKILAKKLQ